jgi:hypothetical protein
MHTRVGFSGSCLLPWKFAPASSSILRRTHTFQPVHPAQFAAPNTHDRSRGKSCMPLCCALAARMVAPAPRGKPAAIDGFPRQLRTSRARQVRVEPCAPVTASYAAARGLHGSSHQPHAPPATPTPAVSLFLKARPGPCLAQTLRMPKHSCLSLWQLPFAGLLIRARKR